MEQTRKPRGFAAMSPERQSEIARKGGLSVAPEKRSFSQDRALASAAGRKGGSVKASERRDGHNYLLPKDFHPHT
jgi:uncharacterized protein